MPMRELEAKKRVNGKEERLRSMVPLRHDGEKSEGRIGDR